MVTAALFLGVPLLQTDGAPRLRTQLSNGATLIVERAAALKSCAIAIAFRADRSVETTESHGWRHLLEHLAAKGKDGQLDQVLESRGWMATAWTYRDSMVFAAIGGKSGLEDAIQAFSGIPKFREASREAIALESRVLAQEVALQSPAQAYSNRSWKNAFGEQGLDPWGSLETIAKATPADIARVATQQFDARGMAIAVVGDIDVKGLTGKAKQAFEAATASEWPVIQIERKRIEGESLSGGVTVDLPPAGTADWIAKVGAALSFSEADTSTSSSFFSISFRPGLLSIFPKPKIGDSSRPDFGRSMFLNWLDTIERNALSRATVTAQLAIVAPDLSIDRLRADAGALSVSAFSDAAKEFAK